MRSLDALLIGKTNEYLLEHHGHGENFAAAVRGEYERQVPKGTLKWSRSEVPSTRLNSDYVKIKRYLDREQHLPAALVGPWLTVLPADYRRAIIAEFLEQFSLMPSPLQGAAAPKRNDTTMLAALMREVAEAVEAISPMLDDGKFGPEDAHLARNALMQLSDVIQEATNLQRRIASVLPTN